MDKVSLLKMINEVTINYARLG